VYDPPAGNHVWNYATKPTPTQNPGMVDYFPGGSKTIEPWFFGSLTNDQVSTISYAELTAACQASRPQRCSG
jgi:hypothetical protein